MNKKHEYEAPKLVTYGTVEEITQAFGDSGVDDTAYIGQQQFAGSVFGLSGSQDGILVPKN